MNVGERAVSEDLGTPLLGNTDRQNSCSYHLYLFFQYFWPCTSLENDLTLQREISLRAAVASPGRRASQGDRDRWCSTGLCKIRHPGDDQGNISNDEARKLRHKQLNRQRGVHLTVFVAALAVSIWAATRSTNNKSSSSPFVPPVPDNSSQFPSASPTFYPTEFTAWPTFEPTWTPTELTRWPTLVPTRQPSRGSSSPTAAPTPWPTSSGQVVINYQQPDTSSWGCSQGGACLGYPGQVLSLSGGGSIQYTAIIQATGETQLYSCDLTNTDQVAALNAWFDNLQCQYYPAEAQVGFKMVLKDSGGNEVSNMDYSQTLFSTRHLRGGSPSVDNKNTERGEGKLTVRG